jgi:hypothetical protein
VRIIDKTTLLAPQRIFAVTEQRFWADRRCDNRQR